MAGLETFAAAFGLWALIGAGVAMGAGGFVKGVVGFALPLVGLSAMASFLPAEVAVALLIVPAVVANLAQSLRNGLGEAVGSFLRFWRLNVIMMVMIALSAQLIVVLPEAVLFGLMGVLVTVFGIIQLAGWRPVFAPRHRTAAETGAALVGGFFGGLSGVWGPPIVMYLLAAGVERVEMVRAQSVSYLLGSLVLVAAHLRSGVLNEVTAPVSAWLVLPAMAGMFLGYRVQERLDQDVFRTLTLAVLVLAGLNLLRRAAGG